MQVMTVQKEENLNLLLVVENVSPTEAKKSSEHKYSTLKFLQFLAHFKKSRVRVFLQIVFPFTLFFVSISVKKNLSHCA